MTRLLHYAAGTALAAVLSTPAVARDVRTIHNSFVYYDVTGGTVLEILQSLDANKPADSLGYLSVTRFAFQWNANTQVTTDAAGKPSCRAFNAWVVVHNDIVLPRHPTIAEAPPEVQKKWQDFIDATVVHELQHAKDFSEIGFKIPDAINAIERPTCDEIGPAVSEVGQDFLEQAKKAGLDFDVLTNHGEKQGAVLSP